MMHFFVEDPPAWQVVRKTGPITKTMVWWVQRPRDWVHRPQGTFSLYQMRKELDGTRELVKYCPGTWEPRPLNCKKKRAILRLYWSSGDLRYRGDETLREIGNNWTSRPPKGRKFVEEVEGELRSQLELWLGFNVITFTETMVDNVLFALLCVSCQESNLFTFA